jgi:CO/xanthine dehydrogenase FAD-binding subunit
MQPTFIMTRGIKEFGYFSPMKLEEAVTLLKRYGNRAVILAGGSDLLVDLKYRSAAPEYIINIKNISKMTKIQETRDGGLSIGALATIAQMCESKIIKKKYPSLHQATTEAFHSWQIRNAATIGGNICRSSPASDTVPPLITYDAQVKLVGSKGQRKVPLEDFFIGVGQNVVDREILIEVILPPQKGSCGTAFLSLKRTSVDLCKLNCAVKVVMKKNRFDDIRIVLGAVSPTAVRAKKTEEALRGKEASDENIENAARKVPEDISPITDGRSTAEYRRQVSQVVVRRLIKQAVGSV